jgi:hypothetical protein
VCAECGRNPPTLATPDLTNALAILRYVIDLPTEVEVTVATHDFDGNGVVEIADALLVLRSVIGLSTPQAADRIDRRAEATRYIRNSSVYSMDIHSNLEQTVLSDEFPWESYVVPRNFLPNFELSGISANERMGLIGLHYATTDDSDLTAFISMLLNSPADEIEYYHRSNNYTRFSVGEREFWHRQAPYSHGFGFNYGDVNITAWIPIATVPDLTPQQIFERYLSDMIPIM